MKKFRKGDKARCVHEDICGGVYLRTGDVVTIDEVFDTTFRAITSAGTEGFVWIERFDPIRSPALNSVAYIKSCLDALKDSESSIAATAIRNVLLDVLRHGHGITARLETVTTRTWVFEDADAKDTTS